MTDDPNRIADHLIEQHGDQGALTAMREGIAAAHASGDKYRLSIWREVRQVLQDRRDAARTEAASAV